jgi:mannose-binding lectin 2
MASLQGMLAMAALVGAARANDVIPPNSFMRPFTDHDLLGSREIKYWKSGGDAKIKKHFTRLTTDRQSKRGWLLNKENVESADWVATFHFRISGQGDRLFGDGMALWFIDDAENALAGPRGGEPILGGPSTFKGVGVLLDTFQNSGTRTHKDVSVVVNDGSKEQHAWEGLDLKGCDADFRYHEKRDDFDASKNFTALRVTYKSRNRATAGTLRIDIDKRGTDEWMNCVPAFALIDDMPFLPATWSKTARFGISAKTGALADNHDVISFQLEPWTPANEFGFGPRDRDMQDEEIVVIEKAMPAELVKLMKDYSRRADEKLEAMQHTMEHKLEQLEEALTNTMSTLREKEDALSKEGRARGEATRRNTELIAELSKRGGAGGGESSAKGGSGAASAGAQAAGSGTLRWILLLLVGLGAAFAAWKRFGASKSKRFHLG